MINTRVYFRLCSTSTPVESRKKGKMLWEGERGVGGDEEGRKESNTKRQTKSHTGMAQANPSSKCISDLRQRAAQCLH